MIECFEFWNAFDPIFFILFFETLKFQVIGGEYIYFAILIGTNFNIIEFCINGGGDIRAQSPWCRRPNDEVFAFVSWVDEWIFDEERERSDIFTAFDDFHL